MSAAAPATAITSSRTLAVAMLGASPTDHVQVLPIAIQYYAQLDWGRYAGAGACVQKHGSPKG
jgi:hypothetical protein